MPGATCHTGGLAAQLHQFEDILVFRRLHLDGRPLMRLQSWNAHVLEMSLAALLGLQGARAAAAEPQVADVFVGGSDGHNTYCIPYRGDTPARFA